MQPSICRTCRTPNPQSSKFCLQCGSKFPTLIAAWTAYQWLGVGITALFVVGVAVLASYSKPQREAQSVSAPRADTAAAVQRLQAKLVSVPESASIFTAFHSGEVTGVLRVQVSNSWFNSRPYQRRQLTQMLANLWQQEMGERPAILHIYDISGREVAGTKALGGIWVEDE